MRGHRAKAGRSTTSVESEVSAVSHYLVVSVEYVVLAVAEYNNEQSVTTHCDLGSEPTTILASHLNNVKGIQQYLSFRLQSLVYTYSLDPFEKET